jgi:hypothetical protein
VDRESFFDGLNDEADAQAEKLRAVRQLSYEERIIKRVFRECGVAQSGVGADMLTSVAR